MRCDRNISKPPNVWTLAICCNQLAIRPRARRRVLQGSVVNPVICEIPGIQDFVQFVGDFGGTVAHRVAGLLHQHSVVRKEADVSSYLRQGAVPPALRASHDGTHRQREGHVQLVQFLSLRWLPLVYGAYDAFGSSTSGKGFCWVCTPHRLSGGTNMILYKRMLRFAR